MLINQRNLNLKICSQSSSPNLYSMLACVITPFCICRTLMVIFSDAGFYGRPWTMEQRKELFRRYGQSWAASAFLLCFVGWHTYVKQCISQATEMGTEHIPLCTQRRLQASDVLERALLSRRSRWWKRTLLCIICLEARVISLNGKVSPDNLFWPSFLIHSEQLMTLISAAKEHAIEFIYAISPGLDITFSNQKEVSALKRKLDQVSVTSYIL